MKTIILDTNFLIYLIKFKIDLKKELDRIILSQYQLCILDKTINELKMLENRKETSLTAKIALHLTKNFRIIKSKMNNVDDSLKQIASEDVIIATQDRELKKAIKTPVIIIRQKSHLEMKNC